MFYSNQENRRKSWYYHISLSYKSIFGLAAILGILLIGVSATTAWYAHRAKAFPIGELVIPAGSTILYDIENQPLGSLTTQSRLQLRTHDLCPEMIDAIVAREDVDFFKHSGVNFVAILRSIWQNISSMRYKQGASTISMQLARNIYELHDETIDRKLLEIALTYRIERRYDKYTILTQYLNRIYYGQSCYGLPDAAHYYFDKKVNDLTLSECAMLAGIIRGPSILNPVASMKSAKAVKVEVLKRMLDLGKINQARYDVAFKEEINLNIQPRRSVINSYPIMLAQDEMREVAPQLAETVEGNAVISKLHLGIQRHIEAATEEAMSFFEGQSNPSASWIDRMGGSAAQKQARIIEWNELKRPKNMPNRLQNDLSDILQCSVLVLDSRLNHKGNLLAVTAGRSAADGLNRWHTMVKPGRAAAPLVFCAASIPSTKDHYILPRSAELTGERCGYDVVRSFADSLRYDIKYPDKSHASNLYAGNYEMRRLDLARLHYSMLHRGHDYRLSLIKAIYSNQLQALYADVPDELQEFIRRECAMATSLMLPFEANENAPTEMNVHLADGNGFWSLVSREGCLSVFVWVGFDDPNHPLAKDRSIKALVSRFTPLLAYDIYQQGLREMRQVRKNMKERAKAKEAGKI